MKHLLTDINRMISDAIREKNGSKKEAYRAIKNAFLTHITSKNAKPLDDTTIVSILKKLIKEREDAISIYDANSRKDLADIEREQCKYIKELLPKEASREDIIKVISERYPDIVMVMADKKNMGKVIKDIKTILPNADGKLVSEIVKSYGE